MSDLARPPPFRSARAPLLTSRPAHMSPFEERPRSRRPRMTDDDADAAAKVFAILRVSEPPSSHQRQSTPRHSSLEFHRQNRNVPSLMSLVTADNAATATAAGAGNSTRRPYFMPYFSEDAVKRGLEAGTLIKGILRVTARSYEEALLETVDDEDGTQDDLLVLGMHDRNRALHGDVVVVRVRPRENWIVREHFYQAWAAGNLKSDVDGEPIPQPPVKYSDEELKNSIVVAGTLHDFSVKPEDARSVTVPQSESREYSRRDFLIIGSQVEASANRPTRTTSVSVAENVNGTLSEIKDDGEPPKSAPPVAVQKKKSRKPKSEKGYADGDNFVGTSASSLLSPELAHLLASMRLLPQFAQRINAPNNNGKEIMDILCPTKDSKDRDCSRAFPSRSEVQGARAVASASGASSSPRKPCYRHLNELNFGDWRMPDVCLQRTGEVVYIAEHRNCRAAMGQLKVLADGNRNFAMFSPHDSRMPRMMVPSDQLPSGFFDRPQEYSRLVFVARMVDWAATAQFARGKLERTLGACGEVETESEGLLYANSLDSREFSPAVLASLPVADPVAWRVQDIEYKYRRDMRELLTLVVSDEHDTPALSLRRLLSVDGWEVGLHVPDVSYFILEGREADKWAAQRGCAVQLVHKTVPVVPRTVSEQLCGWEPAADRLAMSIVWRVDQQGRLLEQTDDTKPPALWLGRTIVRCSARLTCDQAEALLSMPAATCTSPNADENADSTAAAAIQPRFTTDNVVQSLGKLLELADAVGARRREAGRLQLELPKLTFAFDGDHRRPTAVNVENFGPARRMVEEWRQWANEVAAARLAQAFPQTAILRRQLPPNRKQLNDIVELIQSVGLKVDGTSAASISSSLSALPPNTMTRRALGELLAQPMKPEEWVCGVAAALGKHAKKTDGDAEEEEKRITHYSLGLHLYTDWTSPLRHYASLVAQRQLAAALGYQPPPSVEPKDLVDRMTHCNAKIEAAGHVFHTSQENFLNLHVQHMGDAVERGIVVNVQSISFDVLLFRIGRVRRVYVNRLDLAREPQYIDGPPSALILTWQRMMPAELFSPTAEGAAPNSPKLVEQRIEQLALVDVVLSTLGDLTKCQAVIKPDMSGRMRTLADLLKEEREVFDDNLML